MEYLNVPIGHRPPVEFMTTRDVEGQHVVVSEYDDSVVATCLAASATVTGYGLADCLVKMRSLLLAQQQSS